MLCLPRATRTMRLVVTTTSEQRLVPLSACKEYEADEIEKYIREHLTKAKSFGRQLCLDFAGEYVPLTGVEEARLASRLVTLYHNLSVRERLGVQNPESVEDVEPTVEDVNDDEFFSSEESWDEDADGERIVYDETYEMNEDIEMRTRRQDQDEEEIYGLWD